MERVGDGWPDGEHGWEAVWGRKHRNQLVMMYFETVSTSTTQNNIIKTHQIHHKYVCMYIIYIHEFNICVVWLKLGKPSKSKVRQLQPRSSGSFHSFWHLSIRSQEHLTEPPLELNKTPDKWRVGEFRSYNTSQHRKPTPSQLEFH